ncbi:MAG TPA: DUF3300 domain-containing protein [Terriglobia bacterium]|nr:DUF3300 domain-containing protein [Terriglobia bacterium]
MLFLGLFALLLSPGPQEMMIPEGTILPVVLNETLNTARVQENDPVLFTLAEDIRAAGRRGPILIPRGSNVVGRVVRSQRAGHFIGRSQMDIHLQEIITPTGEVYDGVSAKIVDVARKKGEKGEVKADGGIQGPVHRQRDTLLLLFPPTTLVQLLSTPRRGPDIVLPVETRLYVKLMTPIYVESLSKVAVAPAPQRAPVPQFVPQSLAPISPNGIEILVAPVALYPDAILRDLFRASGHPFEIVQANVWVHQIRDSAGSLPPSGYDQGWDSSVKAMTAYPDLLQRLSADVAWMTKLGSAFVAQPTEVLSAVYRLRMQADLFKTSASVAVVASGQ